MKNTGDGTRTSARDLAVHAGCNFSHIGELMTGEQETASYEHAIGICRRIGVDLLILWTPIERADSAVRSAAQPQKASV